MASRPSYRLIGQSDGSMQPIHLTYILDDDRVLDSGPYGRTWPYIAVYSRLQGHMAVRGRI